MEMEVGMQRSVLYGERKVGSKWRKSLLKCENDILILFFRVVKIILCVMFFLIYNSFP